MSADQETVERSVGVLDAVEDDLEERLGGEHHPWWGHGWGDEMEGTGGGKAVRLVRGGERGGEREREREREREGKGKALLLQSSSPCRPWGMGEGKERLEGRKEKKRKEKRNKGDMSLSFRCDCYL